MSYMNSLGKEFWSPCLSCSFIFADRTGGTFNSMKIFEPFYVKDMWLLAFWKSIYLVSSHKRGGGGTVPCQPPKWDFFKDLTKKKANFPPYLPTFIHSYIKCMYMHMDVYLSRNKLPLYLFHIYQTCVAVIHMYVYLRNIYNIYIYLRNALSNFSYITDILDI